MASITIHYHSYEINSLADLAKVRATLEELHNMKRVTDLEYKQKTKQLDLFPRNHHLKYVCLTKFRQKTLTKWRRCFIF